MLLAFFDDGDNFDFLTRNHLFKLHLIYVLPSGQNGFDTNFEALAVYLTNSDGFPNVPADTRNALAAYVDRIEAVESGTVVKPVASYETMCRNYCNALAETDIYYCASVGRDCRDEVLGWGDLCYQERCVSMGSHSPCATSNAPPRRRSTTRSAPPATRPLRSVRSPPPITTARASTAAPFRPETNRRLPERIRTRQAKNVVGGLCHQNASPHSEETIRRGMT